MSQIYIVTCLPKEGCEHSEHGYNHSTISYGLFIFASWNSHNFPWKPRWMMMVLILIFKLEPFVVQLSLNGLERTANAESDETWQFTKDQSLFFYLLPPKPSQFKMHTRSNELSCSPRHTLMERSLCWLIILISLSFLVKQISSGLQSPKIHNKLFKRTGVFALYQTIFRERSNHITVST